MPRSDLDAELIKVIEEIENHFSDPSRECNKNSETYHYEACERHGDVAYLWFRKSSGYYALVVAIAVKDRWLYFFPKHSHRGLELINHYLVRQEELNQTKAWLKKNGY